MLAVAFVVVISVLWWLGCNWRDAVSGRIAGLLPGVRAPLLLIAHPDDECMFFAPTILGLLQGQRPLSALCCSTGNYYNQGETRKKELIKSCAALGIDPLNVTLIDHSDLPDSPTVKWDEHLLSSLVLNHIQEKNIDLIPPQLWKVTCRMLCFAVGICEHIEEIPLGTRSTTELVLRPRRSLYIIRRAVLTGQGGNASPSESTTLVSSYLPVLLTLHDDQLA
ncbi:N-acetylglucosaminyl-phosphatidylinositol de-N-acetylase isoform X2 [Rhinoderma darwinii]|uniref:N-acetylglucosaminyl-phosphatidylinositol de-N-acetylase isoform X2 n=1 Tax=Rhinoderma darwinii TaxID=43563 RepID=UPI003F67CD4A